jgi:hypothetical protein
MRTGKKILKNSTPGIFLLLPPIFFFVNYNSMQNFIILGQPLLGEKYVAQMERIEEEGKLY